MSLLLIKNGTLIDGNGGEPQKNVSVLIEGDKILDIRQNENIFEQKKVTIIDAKGKYILPGFIDSHVHLLMEKTNHMKMLETPFSVKYYQSIDRMKRTIDAGITTVRDLGFTDIGVKEAVEQKYVLGPRMQISVNPLTTTGGHGDWWMRSGFNLTEPVNYPTMPFPICNGVPEVRKKAREMLQAGADFIKVHATGGMTSPTDEPEYAQFSQQEIEVMVEEAYFHGDKKVAAHAQGEKGIKIAVKAGVHSIEHGTMLDDEAIELMLKHNTFLIPTLLTGDYIAEAKEGIFPDYVLEKERKTIEKHIAAVSKAYKAGVKIAMGTDAGVMPHGTNMRELKLMCDIGMSPMEAIVATTKTGAECLEWEHKLGTVEKGKLADIVIVDKNPLEDITVLEDTNNISTVIKDGEVVKKLN